MVGLGPSFKNSGLHLGHKIRQSAYLCCVECASRLFKSCGLTMKVIQVSSLMYHVIKVTELT